MAGSPADKAGLTSALSQFKVSDDATLTIIRSGKTITIHVTLESAPSQ